MKTFAFKFVVAVVAVSASFAFVDASDAAYKTHALLEKSEDMSDKLITAMDNVAQAVAAADKKITDIIEKMKTEEKNQKSIHSTTALSTTDVASVSNAAGSSGSFDWKKFMPGAKDDTSKAAGGGNDWQKYIPGSKENSTGTAGASSMPDWKKFIPGGAKAGKGSGKSTSKLQTTGNTQSSPAGKNQGYDWSKWAPGATSKIESIKEGNTGVMLASLNELTAADIASEAKSMSEQAAAAADKLSEMLKDASNKLLEASSKLKEKVEEYEKEKQKPASSVGDTSSSSEGTSITANLRNQPASQNIASSAALGIFGVLAIGGVFSAIYKYKQDRFSYERF